MQPRAPIVNEKYIHKIAPLSLSQFEKEEPGLGHVNIPKVRAFDKVEPRGDPNSKYPFYMQRSADRNGLKTMINKTLKENNFSNRDMPAVSTMFQSPGKDPNAHPRKRKRRNKIDKHANFYTLLEENGFVKGNINLSKKRGNDWHKLKPSQSNVDSGDSSDSN